MAENYSFFMSKEHDRVYNARHWADYFFPLFKSGVFNGDLQVVENGGMTIKIKSGYAWIDGYSYHLTDGLQMDLETASGNMNRMDSIVIRLDLTNRWIKAFYKAGSYYEGEPVPPEREITKTVHEIVIARIKVSAGKTVVTQDMIEDTRMNPALCGWVCGAVQQITFEQIYEQFKAFQKSKENEINEKVNEYETWKNGFIEDQENRLETKNQQWTEQFEMLFNELEEFKDNAVAEFSGWLTGSTNNWEEEFFTWFGNLKEQLTENVAINLQSQIGDLSELKTADKTSLTAAVNEIKEDLAETVEEVNGSIGETVKELADSMGSFAKSSIYADDHISLGRKESTAVGEKSIAYGEEVEASGKGSQVFGIGTIARGEGQLVHGKYNHNGSSVQADNLYAEIVGGGSSDVERKDIYTLDWNGTGRYAGEVWGKDIIADPKKGRWYYLTKALQMIESGFVRNGTVTVPLRGGSNYILVTSEWNAATGRVYGFRARMYTAPFDIWNNLVAPTAANLCATSAAGVTLGTVQTTALDGYGITLTVKDFYVYYYLYLLGEERD